MSKKSKVNEKLCIMCNKEKEDVKPHKLLFFNKNLCHDCYYEKITSTIKVSAIISGIYIIPLLITFIIDSANAWELTPSPFFITYLILSILTFLAIFYNRSLFSGYLDSYFSDYFMFTIAAGSNKEQNDALTTSVIVKVLAIIFKILIGALVLPIVVAYNVIILINAILVFKEVSDKIRMPIVIGLFLILACAALILIIGILSSL